MSLCKSAIDVDCTLVLSSPIGCVPPFAARRRWCISPGPRSVASDLCAWLAEKIHRRGPTARALTRPWWTRGAA